jgi:glyoxylase-like metal-dependent hydrolase (beta-lactamase superfamily II)
MKIGEFELFSIVTSEFKLDGGAMFGIIPKPLWERKALADDRNRIKMVTRSLLLVNDKRRILIDTGNGNKWQEKFREIYEIDTSNKNLDTSLARVGLTTDDISDVLCTHLHFDHVGGNTSLEGGRIIPTFPNADYWVQKENWELANSPSEKDQGSFMEADWAVLAENNMVNLVDGKETFIPGIDIILTYGHTTGQMHPLISDENRTLMYCGDLIPMSAHIPLPWVMAYDIHPVVTIQEKKKHLPRAVNENWILFFEHDPELQACTVQFDGKHYKPKDPVTVSNE